MKGTAHLRRRILSHEAVVAVVGQGYVGLTVASAAARAGFSAVGVDIDEKRIGELEQGILSVPGVDAREFEEAFGSGRLSFTTDQEAAASSDIILVCVPTPLRDHTPDLSFVEAACATVARNLVPGKLVVLESTTYPGTTDGLVRPILEGSGLHCGHDFLLGYSPERIDPGNANFTFRSTPRIVGAVTPEATGITALFYEQLVDKVFVVSSCRSAELAKLLENTFRHVNVALVNELAMMCYDVGIDVWEVIEAAASKPFGFMPFYPGPGVGGHCIPLDPGYLAWQVRRDSGRQFRSLEQAQDVNAQMPKWVSSRISAALNDHGKALKDSEILVLGVGYKPDIGDVRESPSLAVMADLQRRGAHIGFHDPHVSSVMVGGRVMQRTELTNRVVAAADCVVLLTPHQAYDLDWIADHAPLLFDARNAFGQDRRPNVVAL